MSQRSTPAIGQNDVIGPDQQKLLAVAAIVDGHLTEALRLILDLLAREASPRDARWRCGDCGRGIVRRAARCRLCYYAVRLKDRYVDSSGYATVRVGTHPRARAGRVLEHVLIAERALGRPLPPDAVVHHANGIKADNRPQNLVICQDRAYHSFLHVRQRVCAAGGDPNRDRICSTCRTVKPLARFGDAKRECKACLVRREQRRRDAGYRRPRPSNIWLLDPAEPA